MLCSGVFPGSYPTNHSGKALHQESVKVTTKISQRDHQRPRMVNGGKSDTIGTEDGPDQMHQGYRHCKKDCAYAKEV